MVKIIVMTILQKRGECLVLMSLSTSPATTATLRKVQPATWGRCSLTDVKYILFYLINLFEYLLICDS